MADGRKSNGGARKHSGRKPKAITLLKRQLTENGKEDAEYAYSLFVSIMRDESQTLGIRVECADWIANRVMGKPTEKHDVTATLSHKGYCGISPDDWDTTDDSSAPGT